MASAKKNSAISLARVARLEKGASALARRTHTQGSSFPVHSLSLRASSIYFLISHCTRDTPSLADKRQATHPGVDKVSLGGRIGKSRALRVIKFRWFSLRCVISAVNKRLIIILFTVPHISRTCPARFFNNELQGWSFTHYLSCNNCRTKI